MAAINAKMSVAAPVFALALEEVMLEDPGCAWKRLWAVYHDNTPSPAMLGAGCNGLPTGIRTTGRSLFGQAFWEPVFHMRSS